MLTTFVVLCGCSLVSCGDDDPVDKPNTENKTDGNSNNGNNNNGDNNNGDNNNGNNAIDAPKELFRAWQRSGSIYVFNENGRGQLYYGWDYMNKTVESITDFNYSYNSQNSIITYMGTNYYLAFINGNTAMKWSNNEDELIFYIYDGELPKVGGNEGGGNEGGGNNSGQTPASPTGLDAQINGTSIYITWQSVNSATSYNVYRASDANSSYSIIGTSYYTSYIDNNPLSGYNYYKVSAVNDNGESQQSNYTSCIYNGGGSSTIPNAPTDVTATNQGSQAFPSILISWSPVPDATSYKVFRSSSSGGSYSQIGSSTSSTSMYDNNPLSGSNYYKVKAVNSAGESSYSSYAFYDNNVEYSPCPPTVSVSGTTSQTVKWSNPNNSSCGKPTSYEVYKRNPSSGNYELLKTTSTTSYSPSSSDIHPGINMYAVKAINNSGSDQGYAYSQDVPLAKPSSFTAQKSGSDVKFTWSKVKWATGYQIYECSSATGNYTILDQITDGDQTTLTRYYPASSGTTRYFKIRAYFECPWVTLFTGEFSAYKSVKF